MALFNTPTLANVVSSTVAGIQSESLYAQPLDWQNDDDYSVKFNQSIIISCPNKKAYIVGLLSDGVKLSGQSDWENITSNNIVDRIYKAVQSVDATQQMGFIPARRGGTTAGSAGISYIQPWASRKFWKGSHPFDLTFNFNLISKTDGKEQVYEPAVKLLSLCYPRKLGTASGDSVITAKEAVQKNFGSVFNVGGTGTDGKSNLITSVLDALESWSIPGPSLTYSGKNDSSGSMGDTVTIMIGNLFVFGACYVKKVDLEFSPSFDNKGYPLWCKCSISFETLQSNYVNTDGSFNLSEFPKGSEKLANVLSSIANTGKTLIIDFIEHEKKLWAALTN